MRDYDIESDLKQEKFQSIKLVQGDRGNKIKINVYEDGQPVNLAGCSVTAKYKRVDGEIINDGVIENIHDNSFDAVMDSSITKVAGTLKMLFTIEKDAVKVSAFLLLADVREGIGESSSSGGSAGGGEVTVDLTDYYKKIETYSRKEIDAQFKDIVNKKIDDITLSNNVLTLLANNNSIKTITLPTSTTGTGANGKEIELQKSTDYIQWRYVGDTNWNNLVALTELKGNDGAKGAKGDTGATGQGIISGGTTGQILSKKSNADYDTGWINIPSGGNSDTLVTVKIANGVLTLTKDKYQTTTITDGTEITLPTVTDFTEIHLFFNTTTDLTLILPSCKWQNGNNPTISANKTYEFIFTYTTEWLGGVIVYE